MRSYCGSDAVRPGNKAIKVTLNSGRTVDVLAAKQFRKFTFFQSVQVESHVEGVEFQDKAGRIIINYPKEHIKNGEAKNALARTAYRYRQTVRMFKNARNCASDKRLPSADVAPSYFVECMLYNVPDNLFSTDRQVTFSGVIDYLSTKLVVDEAMCQNGQVKLFGNTSEQWDVAKARVLLSALISLWNNW